MKEEKIQKTIKILIFIGIIILLFGISIFAIISVQIFHLTSEYLNNKNFDPKIYNFRLYQLEKNNLWSYCFLIIGSIILLLISFYKIYILYIKK